MRRRSLLVALLLVAATSGCLGGPGTGSSATTTTTTAATTTTTDDMPAYGTQFVSVEKYEDQRTGENWPASERSTFENLTAEQQDAFLRALEDGQLEYAPDESNPFDFNGNAPRVVKYDGSWYYVRVSIV